MTSSLAVTGFYAAILAILFIALTFMVIKQRKSQKVGLGVDGDDNLLKAVRIHGNFTEFVPMALILLAACELNGSSTTFLHTIGGALVTCRFLHAIGLTKSRNTSWQRFVSVLGTMIIILVLAITNIINML
ncbi:MAPEG family protein [Thalassotalea crassostreae]|uniref:MAPEG family protein n=1 Tax=Thalassotalea crassostreae TaxID=1763536 RepID=UPI000838CDCC|nr:MAPEG family protein [Thalassotalea crassostreae]